MYLETILQATYYVTMAHVKFLQVLGFEKHHLSRFVQRKILAQKSFQIF